MRNIAGLRSCRPKDGHRNFDRLDASIAMESQLPEIDGPEQHAKYQAALCGAAGCAVRRLGGEMLPLADRAMHAFMQILKSSEQTGAVVEDAFLAIGAIINGTCAC